MYPLYEGRSCLPSGYNYTNTCLLGAYPWVVVNVSAVQDVQYSVNFARNLNLRVVKNTCHDFIGRASGKGAQCSFAMDSLDKGHGILSRFQSC